MKDPEPELLKHGAVRKKDQKQINKLLSELLKHKKAGHQVGYMMQSTDLVAIPTEDGVRWTVRQLEALEKYDATQQFYILSFSCDDCKKIIALFPITAGVLMSIAQLLDQQIRIVQARNDAITRPPPDFEKE